MWRYRWLLVIVAWAVAIPGWFIVYNMPDVYEASAKVSVDTNSLLPGLTKGLTASENLVDEVDLVSKALLTRPNLADVARETDLDLRAQTPQQMEGLITSLQRRVSIRGGRDKIFTIAFEDPNRDKATAVVAALLNTFMESSLGAQGDDAEMSERAIKLEIDDHEKRLIQAESDLAEFKKRNLGYMPDDSGDYYSRLQAGLAKVEDARKRLRLLSERREEITRQLAGEDPLLSATTSTSDFAYSGCSKSANLLQLQSQLSALQVDFTDKHPRIVMLRETIAALEEDCATELAALGGSRPLRNAETQGYDANPVYQNLRMQLSQINVERAALQQEYQSYQDDVARLRVDVDKIADVEAKLKMLNRDYGVVAGRHQDLLGRWETLQSKKRLDPVTDSVQFNILEPPFAMATPVAPNRPLLLAIVLLVALGAGGAVAFGLNQLKPVFFNRRTLAQVAGLPVLGSVSMIMSPDEITARHRKTIAWTGANLALLVLGTAVIALANPISQILRNLTGSGF
jgi:polysaccharide chain length determinant protein (PEP-CTERM system associated)